jgi:hypothetical protein
MPIRFCRPLVLAALLALGHAQSVPSPHSAPKDELPGVPVAQEPHHHLVLSNPYVRTWEVEVPPHQATLMHQHPDDYLYLVLGSADLTNQPAGKPPARIHLPDSAVNFSRGPLAHAVMNDGSAPFRNITIELVHPQGEFKNFFPSMDAALASAHDASTGVTMLESNEVLVTALRLQPGAKLPNSTHDRLIVLPDQQDSSASPREPNAPMFPAGLYHWIAAGNNWQPSASLTQPMRVLVLEFKDSGS